MSFLWKLFSNNDQNRDQELMKQKQHASEMPRETIQDKVAKIECPYNQLEQEVCKVFEKEGKLFRLSTSDPYYVPYQYFEDDLGRGIVCAGYKGSDHRFILNENKNIPFTFQVYNESNLPLNYNDTNIGDTIVHLVVYMWDDHISTQGVCK